MDRRTVHDRERQEDPRAEGSHACRGILGSTTECWWLWACSRATRQGPRLILPMRTDERCSCGLPGSTRVALAASRTILGETELHAQGTGRSGGRPTGLRAGTCPPENTAEPDTRQDAHPVQSVRRVQDSATPRVLIEAVGRPVRPGRQRRHDRAAAGQCTGTMSGTKRRELTIAVQDGSMFLRIGTNGRKPWSRVGDPVTVCRHGRRDRTVVFGAPTGGGTCLMRRYERFDGPTFVRYLRKVRRRQGRILLVPDNAGQHKHRDVKKIPEGTRRGGDPVPVHRHTEARSSRVCLEGRKVQACHLRTLQDVGGPDACSVQVLQDVPNQA